MQPAALLRWRRTGVHEVKGARPGEELPARGTTGFALAIVLVLIGALVYDRHSNWIDHQFAQIERQRDTLAHLDALETRLTAAASAARGFASSAEPFHLEEYKQASDATRSLLVVMAWHPGSADEPLLRQAESYLDSLDAIVSRFTSRVGTAITDSVPSIGGAGKTALDQEINVQRAQFADALLSRRGALTSDLRRSRYVNWAAAGVAAGLLIAFWVLLRRSFKQREQALDALTTANANLEQTVRTRTAELTDLSQHLLTVRDEERASLAREIHDEIGSELMVVRMECDRLQSIGTGDVATAKSSWSRIRHALTELTAAHRRIINSLHPTVLDHLGLEAAIEALVDELLKPSGLRFEIRVAGILDGLPPALTIAAYRIVQEAIGNVLKHAHAKNVTVELLRDATGLTLQVTDDGVGLGSQPIKKGRLGVVGMRERAHQLGGSFKVAAGPGSIGTRIMAQFPMVATAAAETASGL